MKFDIGKGLCAWPETYGSTGTLSITHYSQRCLWHTMMVSLGVDFAAAIDGEQHFFRERVNHRHTYPVQTAGDFIGVVVKFTAGVQYSHDDFCRRHVLFRMHFGRDTTTVIAD
ncbi:Uncharacterised protein [Vibrio cholerae]|nr:Uncharacterised protein [Vibrio cholerae]